MTVNDLQTFTDNITQNATIVNERIVSMIYFGLCCVMLYLHNVNKLNIALLKICDIQ